MNSLTAINNSFFNSASQLSAYQVITLRGKTKTRLLEKTSSTRSIKKILSLCEKAKWKGVVLYLGTELLKKDILQSLAGAAQKHIICCAHTQTLLEDLGVFEQLNTRAATLAYLPEQEVLTPDLRTSTDWSFIISPLPSYTVNQIQIQEQDLAEAKVKGSVKAETSSNRLTQTVKGSEKPRYRPPSNINVVSNTAVEVDHVAEKAPDNPRFNTFLKNHKPEPTNNQLIHGFCPILWPVCRDSVEIASALKMAKIATHDDFTAHWRKLDKEIAESVQEKLLNTARAPYASLLVKQEDGSLVVLGTDHRRKFTVANAFLSLCRFMPPWNNRIPETPVRLNNAFAKQGMRYFKDIVGVTDTELLRFPSLGVKTITDGFIYQMTISPKGIDNPFLSFDLDERRAKYKDRKMLKVHEKMPMHQHVDKALMPDRAFMAVDHDQAYEHYEKLVNDLYSNQVSLSGELTHVIDSLEERGYLDQRDAYIIRNRLAGDTLNEIGKVYNVTRERIRQIEHKAFKKLRENLEMGNTHALPQFRDMVKLALYLVKKEHFMPEDMDKLSAIFGSTEALTASLSTCNLLDYIFKPSGLRVRHLDVCNQDILLPIVLSEAKWLDQDMNTILKDASHGLIGRAADEALEIARQALCRSLNNRFFASLFAHDLIHFKADVDHATQKIVRLRYDRRPVPVVIGEMVADIVRTQGEPLSITDGIYPRMPASYQAKHDKRVLIGQIDAYAQHAHPKDPDYLFNIGHNSYALWEHFNLSESQEQRLINNIRAILKESPLCQFSDRVLFDELNKRGQIDWDYGRHWFDKRVISVVLTRNKPEDVQPLKRFNWCYFDTALGTVAQERLYISDMVIECIKRAHAPIPKTEILKYIESRRPLGAYNQIQQQHGIVRLGRGRGARYWYEGLDPVPMSDHRVKLLINEIRQRIADIKQSENGSISLSRFKAAFISQYKDIADRYTLHEFAALMMRIQGVVMDERDDGYWVKV